MADAGADISPNRMIGTLSMARAYLEVGEAASELSWRSPPRTTVTYFLGYRSLELMFKSVVILHGTNESKLKKLGHNIESCKNAAAALMPELNMILEPDEWKGMLLGASEYRIKGFEYVQPGFRTTLRHDVFIANCRRIFTWIEKAGTAKWRSWNDETKRALR